MPLFRDLVADPDIADGDYDIHWLEKLSCADDRRMAASALRRVGQH